MTESTLFLAESEFRTVIEDVCIIALRPYFLPLFLAAFPIFC
jgi:hypothetical protein